MPTTAVKALEVDEEWAEEDADAIKKFTQAHFLMAILIVLQRSPILPWTKNAVLLLGTIVEKCWTWKAVLPTLSTVGGWHSLSGASSYVTSSQSNMSTVTAGDYFSFEFYTRGYRANSYRVVGLPAGLSYNGNNTISGVPTDAGTYNIGITGYRWSGLNGPSTATYSLTLTVKDKTTDTDGDGTEDSSDLDDDGDGIVDTSDAFPLDASESLDTDLDGIGNNADIDDDGDGVEDTVDAFPLDPTESMDSDNDGVGDNADTKDDRNIAPPPLSIWSDQNTSELGNGWYQSSWFGYFFGNSGGWTYHSIHKWIYLSEINDGGLWIYDEQLGWLYTNQEIFPYLYQNSSNHWLYDQSDTNSRKFWDSSTFSFIYPN